MIKSGGPHTFWLVGMFIAWATLLLSDHFRGPLDLRPKLKQRFENIGLSGPALISSSIHCSPRSLREICMGFSPLFIGHIVWISVLASTIDLHLGDLIWWSRSFNWSGVVLLLSNIQKSCSSFAPLGAINIWWRGSDLMAEVHMAYKYSFISATRWWLTMRGCTTYWWG